MWKSYVAFCIFYQRRCLPASAFTLSVYAQLLSRSFKSVKSIKNYISATKTLHVLLDKSTKAFDSMQLSMTLKGLARINPRLPKRAHPVTPAILLKFLRFLNLKDPIEATVWCLFLVAFFSMSRKSNLVLTQSSSATNKFLRRRDVTFKKDSITLSLHWSKTNQFGEKVHQVPLIKVKNSPLCPVKAMSNMLSLVPGKPEDPLFMLPNKRAKLRPMTYREYQFSIKELINMIGLNPKAFSTHSFRRGGATHAFNSNVPSELIKEHGDWASDAYLLYLQFSFEQKLTVSHAMSANLSD